MSSRFRDPEVLEPAKPSKCSRVLYYTWKVITCIFSHITLVSMVVLYCLLGAWAFHNLESDNEKLVSNHYYLEYSNVNFTVHMFLC